MDDRTAAKRIISVAVLLLAPLAPARGGELLAGAASADITDRSAGPVNDPCYAKALVLTRGGTKVVLITLDAVATGEIGRIGDDFLPALRGLLEREAGIPPSCVVVSATLGKNSSLPYDLQ